MCTAQIHDIFNIIKGRHRHKSDDGTAQQQATKQSQFNDPAESEKRRTLAAKAAAGFEDLTDKDNSKPDRDKDREKITDNIQCKIAHLLDGRVIGLICPRLGNPVDAAAEKILVLLPQLRLTVQLGG